MLTFSDQFPDLGKAQPLFTGESREILKFVLLPLHTIASGALDADNAESSLSLLHPAAEHITAADLLTDTKLTGR